MKIWVSLIIVVIGAAVYIAFSSNDGQKPVRNDRGPTPVIVTPVIRDVFVERVEALGTTRAAESITITSNVTETVASIHFEDGMHVRQGDLIVTLAKSEEDAQLAAARVNLAEQQREYRRIEGLVRDKTVPESQLDERRTQVEIAKLQIRETQARMDDRILTAPFDGVLGLRQVSVGALVSPGDVITTLDKIDTIKVDFSVPAVFLARLRPGLPIVVSSPALADETFSGTITQLDSRVDPVTRSIVARAELPNPDERLKPGILMTIDLIKDEREVLIVPEESLVPLQDRTYVWVIDQTDAPTAVRTEVTIGLRRPGEVEVVTGLAEGQLVIVRGTTRVQPDAPIQIIETRSPDRGQLAQQE